MLHKMTPWQMLDKQSKTIDILFILPDFDWGKAAGRESIQSQEISDGGQSWQAYQAFGR